MIAFPMLASLVLTSLVLDELAGFAVARAQSLPAGDSARPADALSRDVRSASYCSERANAPGFYDTEAALACRREEYTAAARARTLTVSPDIDGYCESLAAEGDPVGPFSWRAYVDCVDGLQP